MKDVFFMILCFIIIFMKSKYIQLMNVTNGAIIKISVCTFTFNPDICVLTIDICPRYIKNITKFTMPSTLCTTQK